MYHKPQPLWPSMAHKCIINPGDIGVFVSPNESQPESLGPHTVAVECATQAEPVKAVQLAADAEIYFQREQDRCRRLSARYKVRKWE